MRCVTFTACLVVAGCGEEKKPPPPPAPVDGVDVVRPGSEPRTLLRYQLVTADTPTELDLELDVDLRTMDRVAALPTLVLGVDHAVTQVDAAGVGALRMTVVAARARARDPQAAMDPKSPEAEAVKLMDRQSALLVGLAVAYTLSPAGAASGSKIDAAGRDLSRPMAEQTATLLSLGEQLAMPLPDVPLGVGAVWKHRRTITQNQLTLVTTTTVEVTAIEGPIVSYTTTTAMTGADQTITQGSATAKVTGIEGTGSATGKLDLARAVVLGQSRATLAFQLIVDGQTRPTKLDMVTRFGPRTPPPSHEPDNAVDTDPGSPTDAGSPADPAEPSSDAQ